MPRDALLLLLLLSACPSTAGDDDTSDDDDSVDDDDTSDDDDSTPDRIEPVPGLWSLTLGEVTSDDCDLVPSASTGDSLGSTTLALDSATGGFTLTDSDDQTFHCTWTEGDAFVCDADPWTDSINAALFPNATLQRAGSRSGTFVLSTGASLDNINVDTCEGADCPLVEQAGGYTFPCTLAFTATMAR